MSLLNVRPGDNLPHECNVIIEIPKHADPVKYEVDKTSGVLVVDRFIGSLMRYPANYGFIPETIADDGDPVDVLVVTPLPIVHGAIIPCRPVGVLMMTDEGGDDAKIIAVPTDKLTPLYHNVKTYQDLPEIKLEQIKHFFELYKALEPGKWVKIRGWEGVEAAHAEIMRGLELYKQKSANN
ncbi:MAG: inorganic pyrophosphatase [Gallionellales bacterium GWA2_60_18]|nr:MAG: inorganic pyrophosphatase [Gallionellales bacterium GWA2_60_18]